MYGGRLDKGKRWDEFLTGSFVLRTRGTSFVAKFNARRWLRLCEKGENRKGDLGSGKKRPLWPGPWRADRAERRIVKSTRRRPRCPLVNEYTERESSIKITSSIEPRILSAKGDNDVFAPFPKSRSVFFPAKKMSRAMSFFKAITRLRAIFRRWKIWRVRYC